MVRVTEHAEWLCGPIAVNESLCPIKRHTQIGKDCKKPRLTLRQLLQANPELQVDDVAPGTAALEALLDRHYSVALVDLRIPGLDGMQLIEEVQKRRLP